MTAMITNDINHVNKFFFRETMRENEVKYGNKSDFLQHRPVQSTL